MRRAVARPALASRRGLIYKASAAAGVAAADGAAIERIPRASGPPPSARLAGDDAPDPPCRIGLERAFRCHPHRRRPARSAADRARRRAGRAGGRAPARRARAPADHQPLPAHPADGVDPGRRAAACRSRSTPPCASAAPSPATRAARPQSSPASGRTSTSPGSTRSGGAASSRAGPASPPAAPPFAPGIARQPDRDEVAVVSHWGFIRGLTGAELHNTEFDPARPRRGVPGHLKEPSTMADTPAGPNGEGAPQAAGAAGAAALDRDPVRQGHVVREPARTLRPAAGQPRPEIQIRVDVRTAEIGEGRYEVVIDINVDAKAGDAPVFLVELSYGGLFELANIPADSLQPLLQIECPRLLFPFARRVVADATRDGGFPPLMIDPIDFVALFRRKVQAGRRDRAGLSGCAGQAPARARRLSRRATTAATSGTSSCSRAAAGSAKPAATNWSNSAWQGASSRRDRAGGSAWRGSRAGAASRRPGSRPACRARPAAPRTRPPPRSAAACARTWWR